MKTAEPVKIENIKTCDYIQTNAVLLPNPLLSLFKMYVRQFKPELSVSRTLRKTYLAISELEQVKQIFMHLSGIE